MVSFRFVPHLRRIYVHLIVSYVTAYVSNTESIIRIRTHIAMIFLLPSVGAPPELPKFFREKLQILIGNPQ